MQDDQFSNLGINDELIKNLSDMGFSEPTRIQELTIPLILEKKDLLVKAQTGSGKTACFGIPLIQLISKLDAQENKSVKALIVTPTRELAIQVTGVFKKIAKNLNQPLSIVTVIGGESIQDQSDSLEEANIVVATPGRLIDFLKKEIISLKEIEYLVLDEADKILDLSFLAELDELLAYLGEKRQNLFFSATYSDKVLEIVKKISNTAQMIEVEDEFQSVDNILQRAVLVNKENKGALLRHLISKEHLKNALIFVASKTAARNLAEKLKKYNIKAGALHGDLTQSERNKSLSDFKAKKVDFLVATDVAARGIDIIKLDLVINFDLPRSPNDYIHRIGRTGRAGETGLAVTLISHEDRDHFRVIEKKFSIDLKKEEIEGFELTGSAPVKQKGQLPVKGKKKSKKDKARELLALNLENDDNIN